MWLTAFLRVMAHVHLHFGNGGKKRANLSALAPGSVLASWWQRDKKKKQTISTWSWHTEQQGKQMKEKFRAELHYMFFLKCNSLAHSIQNFFTRLQSFPQTLAHLLTHSTYTSWMYYSMPFPRQWLIGSHLLQTHHECSMSFPRQWLIGSLGLE